MVNLFAFWINSKALFTIYYLFQCVQCSPGTVEQEFKFFFFFFFWGGGGGGAEEQVPVVEVLWGSGTCSQENVFYFCLKLGGSGATAPPSPPGPAILQSHYLKPPEDQQK